MSPDGTLCHVCGAGALRLFEQVSDLMRVTSDTRPWRSGGELAVCGECGTVVKPLDETWRAEAGEIYTGYDLYHQSADRREQRIFDADSGANRSRSDRLLDHVADVVSFPSSGRMLDVGTGSGAVLRSFAAFVARRSLEGWEFWGQEPHPPEDGGAGNIPGVSGVYACPLSEVPGTFDFVTLNHSLEHVENPVAFLGDLRRLLAQGGLVAVQVPHFAENPFDLLVADHATHFTAETLDRVVRAAGLVNVNPTSAAVPRELTVIAAAGKRVPLVRGETTWRADQEARVFAAVQWLRDVRDSARKFAEGRKIGLFGTAIAANWLLGELGDSVGFFVDEDPARTGRSYRGRPVFGPEDVPPEGGVYVPLSPSLATGIVNRLAGSPGLYEPPPPFPSALLSAGSLAKHSDDNRVLG